MCLAVSRVDEQVKSIVVEGEVFAVSLRHRAPDTQSTVVLASLVIVAAIKTVARTVVSRYYQILDILGYLLFSWSSILESIIIFRFLSLRHAGVDIDELRLTERDGSSTDIGRSHIALQGASFCCGNSSSYMQTLSAIVILYRHQIGTFEGCLTGRNSSQMASYDILIGVVNILRDEVAHLIIALSENATTRFTDQTVSRAIFITSTSRLVLGMRVTVKLRIPGIPNCWVVDPVGQHITGIMSDVVR